MGFYMRKSIPVGPFRFNLSKSGVGLSVGVRGLRIGTGPRGHYIHAGLGGFYYRGSIGRAGERRLPPKPVGPDRPISPLSEPSASVVMTAIDSNDVLEMCDEQFEDIINELNDNGSRLRTAPAAGCILLAAAGLAGYMGNGRVTVALAAMAIVAYLLGRWLDSYRRCTVLFYDLDPPAADAYAAIVNSFEQLQACGRAWHVPSKGAIRDLMNWKRNAGAGAVLDRKAISLTVGLPATVRSNIDPPCIPVGRQFLYFFPDFLMVYNKSRAGAGAYGGLRVTVSPVNFIEEERLPHGAVVVDYTWKHPNKGGGPDRRFKDNWEIPVCAYEDIYFTSDSGIGELIQMSRRGLGEPFSAAIRAMSGPRAGALEGRRDAR
jgi:hypothetical protein